MANLRVKVKDNMWGVKAHIPTSPIEARAHPRVLLVEDDLPAIRSKLTSYYGASSIYSDIQGTFQDAIDECDAYYGTLSTTTEAKWWCSVYALMYLIFKDGAVSGFTTTHTAAQYGSEAVRLTMIIANAGGNQMEDGQWPNANFAYAYDWAYPIFTSEQRSIVASILALSENPVYSTPWSADGCKQTHGKMLAALVLTGDGYQDSWAAETLADWNTQVISPTGVVGELSRGLAPLDGTPMGSLLDNGNGYFSYQWPWLLLMGEEYRTAHGLEKFSHYNLTEWNAVPSGLLGQALRLRPYAQTSTGYPDGYKWLLIRAQYDTDLMMDLSNCNVINPAVASGIWNSIYPEIAQVGMWLARNKQPIDPVTTYRVGRSWQLRFILEDPTITASSPTDISVPLSQRYGDGLCIFRSAWTDNNEGYTVTFQASKYAIGQDIRAPYSNQGHWEIHRKGLQTIKRSAHAHSDYNYPGWRNQLLLRNTNLTVPMSSAVLATPHGGIIRGNVLDQSNRANDIYVGSQIDIADEILERMASGLVDADYVFIDMTHSYPSSRNNDGANPINFTLAHRHFCFFRPPTVADSVIVVIADRISVALAGAEPVFSWNPVGVPAVYQVDGSAATESAHTPLTGDSFGHRKSTNGWYVEAVNTLAAGSPAWDGKNRLTVILPTSRQIVVAGGPDELGQTYVNGSDMLTGSLESVDIYGQRFTTSNGAGSIERNGNFGSYGIQVEPSPTSATPTFLAVNEVCDSSGTPAVCEALTELTNCAGVAILASHGKRIFVFSPTGDQTSMQFTIPTAGTYKCFIANLSGSARTIASSSGTVTNVVDGSGSSGASFSVDTGSKSLYLNIVTNSANATITVS